MHTFNYSCNYTLWKILISNKLNLTACSSCCRKLLLWNIADQLQIRIYLLILWYVTAKQPDALWLNPIQQYYYNTNGIITTVISFRHLVLKSNALTYFVIFLNLRPHSNRVFSIQYSIFQVSFPHILFYVYHTHINIMNIITQPALSQKESFL